MVSDFLFLCWFKMFEFSLCYDELYLSACPGGLVDALFIYSFDNPSFRYGLSSPAAVLDLIFVKRAPVDP